MALADDFANWLGRQFDRLASYFMRRFRSIPAVRLFEDLPPSATETLQRDIVIQDATVRSLIYNAVSVIGYVFSLSGEIARLRWARHFQDLAALFKPGLLSAHEVADGVARGRLTFFDAKRVAARNGLSEEDFNVLVDLTQRVPAVGDLIALYNRGIIDERTVRQALQDNNLRPEWIDRVLAARFAQPTLADLVRFAVREVYDPIARRALSLDEDYPELLDREGEKIGASPELLRDYWAAHWQLPSPTQAYEMLRRGLITEHDLDQLLKAADYAPRWRPLLREISYNPLTRVDVRRMHQLGVLSDAELERAYRDAGYSPENARRLAQFTVLYNAGALSPKREQTRDLTKTEILSAYREQVLERDDATSALRALGYDEHETTTLLLLAEAQQRRAENAEVERSVHDAYIAGQITRIQVITALDQINTPVKRRDALLKRWDIERLRRGQVFTVAQIQQLLRAGLIMRDRAHAELTAIRYTDEQATLLLDLWQRVPPASQVEDELAQENEE